MRKSDQKWISIQTKDLNHNLAQKINCGPILLQLLANRNIKTEEEINSFLNPSIKVLRSPALLPNIDIAVARLKKAIEKKESVLIFGDYDTDGITSSALMFNFLKKTGLDPDIYIPDRFDEGYDISMDFIRNNVLDSEGDHSRESSKKKPKSKYSLIICVDCGTNSSQVKDFILNDKRNEINIIVCDHHEPNDYIDLRTKTTSVLKSKYIIINPKLSESKYPFKNLSGAGVTFKFIFAAFRGLDIDTKSKFGKNYIGSLLDLVAISTIADLMPLVDENRAIVCIGLKILKKTQNYGLKKLIEKFLNDKFLDDKKDINTYDIGFIIAPRLNAAGRIKNAMDSVEILKEELEENDKDNKKEEISRIIEELDSFNIKRQLIQKEILKDILKSEENNFEKIVSEHKIFISKSSEWNEGVLGVVAADLVKKLNIPVILFKEDKGRMKGSGRSIGKFDLFNSINLLKDYFIKFGGHKQACGITIDAKKYAGFKQELIKIVQNKLDGIDIGKHYYYDLEIDFSRINKELISELKRMEPFGIDNTKPVFLTKNCLIQKFKQLRNGKHLSLLLENSNFKIKAVLFNIEDRMMEIIDTGKFIDILFHIEEDNWNNKEEVNLVIVSFDKSPSALISI